MALSSVICSNVQIFYRRGIPVGVLSGPGFCRKYSKPHRFKPYTWNHKNKPQFEELNIDSNKHVSAPMFHVSLYNLINILFSDECSNVCALESALWQRLSAIKVELELF